MPTVFAQRLVYSDNFTAVLAEGRPPCDIRKDRHIEAKLARGLLVVGLHQAPAEGLIGNLGFAAQENVERDFFSRTANFPRKTEGLVIFVNPFIERVGKAKTIARIQFTGEAFIKGRLDEVVGAKQVKVFGLR